MNDYVRSSYAIRGDVVNSDRERLYSTMRRRAINYTNPLFTKMSNDDESDTSNTEQLQNMKLVSSRMCLAHMLYKLERRLCHPKALGSQWRNVVTKEDMDMSLFDRSKWIKDNERLQQILSLPSDKEFRDLFKSLTLRLEHVTSEFAGDDRFVRKDWYYDREAWREDVKTICITDSQLYFALHRFQHDALDWIAIGDVLPDMDRRSFLRGAKLNQRANVPSLNDLVV